MIFRARKAKKKAEGQLAALREWAGYHQKSIEIKKDYSVTFGNRPVSEWQSLVRYAKCAEGYFKSGDYIGVESSYIQARKIVDEIAESTRKEIENE